MRAVRLILFVTVASLILLEAGLQVAAALVWLVNRPTAPAPTGGGDTVLCVGDSWTHGMGSSDAAKYSYPALLPRLLQQQTGRRWRVVNGGQSGQNSRDVLLRLSSQLADCQPRVVCVLVGMNDFWTTPAEVLETDQEEHHATFRFRWRIPRLVAWAFGGSRSGAPSAPASLSPTPGPEWEARNLAWPNPYTEEPWPAAIPEPARAAKDQGWRQSDKGDVGAALESFERALTACPDDPQTRQMLVQLLRKRGRQQQAQTHLGWLETRWTQGNNYWVGRSLVIALDECQRSAAALEVVERMLPRWPDDPILWLFKAQSEFFLGSHASALESIGECIRRWPSNQAFFVQFKIHQLGLRDFDAAASGLFRAYAERNDAEWFMTWLRALVTDRGVRAERIAELLASFVCPPDVRQRLEALTTRVLADRDGSSVARVLAAHLSRIAEKVRRAGAVPVFLEYPLPNESNNAIRAAATAAGVVFLDVGERFGRKLGRRSFAEVRSPDNHVDDEGYRLMAECVAEGLRDVLASVR